jgi:nickel/cobalt exporter
VRVRYVVDMAEVPTFQSKAKIDAGVDAWAPELARGLKVALDGRDTPLQVRAAEMTLVPGQAGLPTLRIALDLSAPLAGTSLRFEDTNFAGRMGWRETVVRAADGVRIDSSTAPSQDTSDELRSYGEQLLDVGSASATFAVTGLPAAAVDAQPRASASAAEVPLPLIGVPPAVALLLALLWGAWHALTPGHGKTIVAAYLVGSRGTAKHALYLGLTVTLTHTIGIYALGVITLFAAAHVLPEQLYPWLSLASGAAVVAVGGWLLFARWRAIQHERAHAQAHAHGHEHHHHHEHDHHHGAGGHSHEPPAQLTPRGLIALGVAGGLLPCPSALVLMLGAIALGQVAFGLLLVVAFSLGLAAVLTGVGMALVYAKGLVDGASLPRLRVPALRWAPVASALLVTALGAAMSVQALAQLAV